MRATVNTTFNSGVGVPTNEGFFSLLKEAKEITSDILRTATISVIWKIALRDKHFANYGEELLSLRGLALDGQYVTFYHATNEELLDFLKEKALNYDRAAASTLAQALKIWSPTLTQKIKNYGYK
jgi:hypothetical protein